MSPMSVNVAAGPWCPSAGEVGEMADVPQKVSRSMTAAHRRTDGTNEDTHRTSGKRFGETLKNVLQDGIRMRTDEQMDAINNTSIEGNSGDEDRDVHDKLQQ